MKAHYWFAGLPLLVVAGAAAVVFSGAYNVAADAPHWAVTKYLMETTRTRSIAARASGLDIPPLDDESMIRAGAGNYDAMCTDCHLKPGLDSSEQSRGLYPAPPDLASYPIDDPAAAFWVIKHGIKMTGMPAWGKSMEDESIWGMVAFLKQLPRLSPDRYQEWVEASGGHQHGSVEQSPDASQSDEPSKHSHDDDHSKAPPHQH